MGPIRMVASYPSIDPATLHEFKQVAAEMLELTRDEACTGQYDFFMSSDEQARVIHENRADSEAALSHAINMGELLPRLVAPGGSVELQWFGNTSPELLKAAQDFRMDVSVYSKMQGLSSDPRNLVQDLVLSMRIGG
jgi:hypothetical protein